MKFSIDFPLTCEFVYIVLFVTGNYVYWYSSVVDDKIFYTVLDVGSYRLDSYAVVA